MLGRRRAPRPGAVAAWRRGATGRVNYVVTRRCLRRFRRIVASAMNAFLLYWRFEAAPTCRRADAAHARGYLQQFRMASDAGLSGPDATPADVTGQELHRHGHRDLLAEAWCHKRGWAAFISGAFLSDRPAQWRGRPVRSQADQWCAARCLRRRACFGAGVSCCGDCRLASAYLEQGFRLSGASADETTKDRGMSQFISATWRLTCCRTGAEIGTCRLTRRRILPPSAFAGRGSCLEGRGRQRPWAGSRIAIGLLD
eukprot:1197441-Pyramimonas_sp.AAC.1